jgi:hypothetical protein
LPDAVDGHAGLGHEGRNSAKRFADQQTAIQRRTKTAGIAYAECEALERRRRVEGGGARRIRARVQGEDCERENCES